MEPTQDTSNLDPLTGEPGSHPIITGFGAAAGGATGAALGTILGPLGTAIGTVVGAVVGGIAGKGVAEGFDPTSEEAYWRYNHHAQPFADKKLDYEDYAPAYRTGYSGYRDGKTFDEREADLRMEYEVGSQKTAAGGSHNDSDIPGTKHPLGTHTLHWNDARPAVQAAYERVAQARVAISRRDAEAWESSA